MADTASPAAPTVAVPKRAAAAKKVEEKSVKKVEKSADKKVVKSATAKKAPKPSDHLKYSEMVSSAISSLKDRKGSSAQAIKKYIITNFKVEEKSVGPHLRTALKRGVSSGQLNQVKGVGANGSFKLTDAAKPKKEAKSPKKTTPKKAAAKKASKSPAKESAKSPAKKVAKKTTAKKTPPKSPKSAAKKVSKSPAKPVAKKATVKKTAAKK